MIEEILKAFAIADAKDSMVPIGTGLIHKTWKLKHGNEEYILQQINQNVFKDPYAIAGNIQLVSEYLHQNFPDYLFVKPILTINKRPVYETREHTFFRLFPFVKGSHSIDVATNPKEAFEAARQFGKFTCYLRDFKCALLKTTLPDFHNLTLRYDQFLIATNHGNKDRIHQAEKQILILKEYQSLVTEFNHIHNNPHFKKRVTHHDTKISNVLFDENKKGICVIDLDTMMPGYFISDVGDMMRTYLSPVNEEETDFSKITIREDYFHSIVTGYLSEMKNELTASEIAHFIYAGKFMIYMQALRFLTDHLNNDQYYGARYENHNLNRAMNQICLLLNFIDKEQELNQIVADSFS